MQTFSGINTTFTRAIENKVLRAKQMQFFLENKRGKNWELLHVD